jgi:hypothetical protein
MSIRTQAAGKVKSGTSGYLANFKPFGVSCSGNLKAHPEIRCAKIFINLRVVFGLDYHILLITSQDQTYPENWKGRIRNI